MNRGTETGTRLRNARVIVHFRCGSRMPMAWVGSFLWCPNCGAEFDPDRAVIIVFARRNGQAGYVINERHSVISRDLSRARRVLEWLAGSLESPRKTIVH